jgi:hypothetical protein
MSKASSPPVPRGDVRNEFVLPGATQRYAAVAACCAAAAQGVRSTARPVDAQYTRKAASPSKRDTLPPGNSFACPIRPPPSRDVRLLSTGRDRRIPRQRPGRGTQLRAGRLPRRRRSARARPASRTAAVPNPDRCAGSATDSSSWKRVSCRPAGPSSPGRASAMVSRSGARPRWPRRPPAPSPPWPRRPPRKRPGCAWRCRAHLDLVDHVALSGVGELQGGAAGFQDHHTSLALALERHLLGQSEDVGRSAQRRRSPPPQRPTGAAGPGRGPTPSISLRMMGPLWPQNASTTFPSNRPRAKRSWASRTR